MDEGEDVDEVAFSTRDVAKPKESILIEKHVNSKLITWFNKKTRGPPSSGKDGSVSGAEGRDGDRKRHDPTENPEDP